MEKGRLEVDKERNREYAAKIRAILDAVMKPNSIEVSLNIYTLESDRNGTEKLGNKSPTGYPLSPHEPSSTRIEEYIIQLLAKVFLREFLSNPGCYQNDRLLFIN